MEARVLASENEEIKMSKKKKLRKCERKEKHILDK